MIGIETAPRAGQIVGERQRTYLVEQVVGPVNPRDSTLVRLSCVDDDAQGQPLEVLWEQELDPRVLSGKACKSIASRRGGPVRLRAFTIYGGHSPECASFEPPAQSSFGWGVNQCDRYESPHCHYCNLGI